MKSRCSAARAFSIIEVLIALVVAVFGFFTFFSVMSTGTHHSTQTRNRVLAQFLAENLIEEIVAHPYGAPAPQAWVSQSDTPAEIWLNGRFHQVVFHKVLEYQNGSFVGAGSEDTDLVKITISWREARGDRQEGESSTNPEDNKVLEVEVPVWR